MNYKKEIEDLHQFFVDWYQAKMAQSEMYFERFSKQISENFGLIPPSGQLIDKDQILQMIWDAHGSMKDKVFRIWIENPRLLWSHQDLQMVSYEEWQEREGEISSRISTAIFKEDSECSNHLRWMHVHETWLKA